MPPADPMPTRATFQQAFAHHQRGELASAENLYREVLARMPGHAGALHMLGLVLHQRGRDREAAESIRAATAANPGDAAAHANLALVLQALREYGDALTSAETALALAPDYPEALNNRGNALHALGRSSDALACYDRALTLAPQYAAALRNRLLVLLALRRPQDAIKDCDRLVAQAPDDADAHAERGRVLYMLKRYADAATAYARVVALAPDFPYAIGTLLRCRLMCCDWTDFAALNASVLRAVERGARAVHPFHFLVNAGGPAAQLACARTYVADQYPPSKRPIAAGRRYGHDRVRVAYLSANFHDHAVAHLAAGLFEAHDRRRFETTAISIGPAATGAFRERLTAAFDTFVDVRADSDRAVAEMLAAAEIDIAVDLTGYTADRRPGILALRPAPIQVNYLGYPGTLGADYIDYVIADRQVLPPEDEPFYAERVVRLPDAYQVNDRKRAIGGETPSRAEAGLPDAGFVFCCFNNNYKIAPDIFDVWMRLLARVDGSVLWLLADNATATANLRHEAERRGVTPERLVFAPRADLARHLARHRLADLFVDTLPYNAHTTASDALWTGLPVVTCLGTTFAGRVAGSLIKAAGLPELVTHDLAAYEALALELATSPARLAALRMRLAQGLGTCALFDTDRTRRHIESAYSTMRERHERGLPPAAFDVAPVA
jgi:protein O-GlcNAc transferase